MARTHGHGNPKWNREETILALDLYFRCDGHVPSGEDARVVELSKVLRALHFHPRKVRKKTFRNPDGVAFKLQNLRSVATGSGLPNASKMDAHIWKEFGSRVREVQRMAARIREDAR